MPQEGMAIDWDYVDYYNALSFLEIMKTWRPGGRPWCTQAAIEQQERVVEKCRGKYEQAIGQKPR